jgi:hypothetical protein
VFVYEKGPFLASTVIWVGFEGSKNKPTLRMEAICSSEYIYIPEDGILHNHRCENLKSCMGGVCDCRPVRLSILPAFHVSSLAGWDSSVICGRQSDDLTAYTDIILFTVSSYN